jgi:putative DNA-invertase from lambdoid prophage Rac
MYREVTMVEVKEVLRLWRAGLPRKRLAAKLGLDPKTVRGYLEAASAAGVRAEGAAVTDAEVRDTLLALAGKLQMHILGAIAEFERARIQERVKAGLARAKAQGVKLGRPRRHIDPERLASVTDWRHARPLDALGFRARRYNVCWRRDETGLCCRGGLLTQPSRPLRTRRSSVVRRQAR